LKKPKAKKIFKIAFWSFTILFALFAVLLIIIEKSSSRPDYIIYRSFFMLAGAIMLIYFPKIFFCVFLLLDSIIRLIAKLLNKIFKTTERSIISKIEGIRVFSFAGLAIFAFTFIIIIHGMFIGRTNFETSHVQIAFRNLPKSFDGLKIAQISDMHLGSFNDSLDVKKGIELLMKEKPDIIFFTGDLINNQAEEAQIMLPELKRLHAPMGMYSILGNHDMSDYRRWNTIEEKTENISNLVKVEDSAGFMMLRNRHYILKKGCDSIAIIGIDNWGKPPFRKYGDLSKAIKGAENVAFKILLSHDPSHWDAEVAGKNNIDLTLSGHTHAMQLGIDCFGIFWSPVSWKYPHWAGLYNEGLQYLYVNRGFGYIGFPGRIGMTPEITMIELKKK